VGLIPERDIELDDVGVQGIKGLFARRCVDAQVAELVVVDRKPVDGDALFRLRNAWLDRRAAKIAKERGWPLPIARSEAAAEMVRMRTRKPGVLLQFRAKPEPLLHH